MSRDFNTIFSIHLGELCTEQKLWKDGPIIFVIGAKAEMVTGAHARITDAADLLTSLDLLAHFEWAPCFTVSIQVSIHGECAVTVLDLNEITKS